MKRILWIVLALVLMAGIAVGTMAATAGGGKSINIDASYSGKQVELSIGESLVVTLASNVTTGYSWTLTGISDESVLQKTKNEYIAPKTNLVGAGGQEVWTFKALKKGTSTISMGYSRPWEAGTPPIETFGLTVVVN
jgi:predicted secreted protein